MKYDYFNRIHSYITIFLRDYIDKILLIEIVIELLLLNIYSFITEYICKFLKSKFDGLIYSINEIHLYS